MKLSKLTRICAALMAFLMTFLVGCSNTQKQNSQVNTQKTSWDVTEYNLSEIVDAKGHYITDKLVPVTVSETRKVGEKRVAYYKGEPYLYYAVHVRYDHILSADLTDAQRHEFFDKEMRLAKEAGYDTVSLYFNLSRLYDGNKVDFSEIEYQYNLAKKYDLNFVITWFGHMVCGFGGYMSWEKDNLEKYPPLKDENGNIMYGTGYAEGKMIPDFSKGDFLKDEAFVIEQVCAWLNVNDKERRCIGIQIEDEPNNTEGGHGLWYSQYENVINFIGDLAEVVKKGPYSMLTYTTLMSSGWDSVVDGLDFKGQIARFMEQEYLDSVGYGTYTEKTDPRVSNIEQGDNPRFMVGFGGCVWSVTGQTNLLLANGYGICTYHLVQYGDTIPGAGGIYRWGGKNDPFQLRDGTQIVVGEYGGVLECVSTDFQIIAFSANEDMAYFNNDLKGVVSETKTLGKKFTFESNYATDKFGSTALLIKENDTTYYTYASKTATLTVEGGIKSASEGYYKNGKWVKNKDVTVVNGKITYEPGKAYKITVS